ncbi:hypothetical protein EYF80_036132 [Liparis tanakae]|uniref:Uncharacterized protein n=1 Tax=Liparis tanakae TaxID=230148 RepID=A0A4Z2GJM4_9TELE|nr:hypothetical protein EYF80_036132 [Liparis tanakae]
MWPVIPASSAEDGDGPRDPDHIPHLDAMSSNLTTDFPLSILPHNRAIWITACPRNTSSPMVARCIAMSTSSLLPAGGQPLRPPLSGAPGCSSNEHSSLHSGSVVFSATQVEYFSFPSWMMVYTSLVPCLPLPRKPLPLSTVTWTCVGNHFWSSSTVSEDMS